jgi:cyclopropane fatty-acyl-phospholipid synthase-like methyltransferase
MPSVEQNLELWNTTYDWSKSGDEWSSAWGGTDVMWQKSLYPRIKDLLPAATILEIAPGFGRCTAYLKNYCERLHVVDLSPRCIEACKQRFAGESHISYYVNDGKSLEMIPDNSIDFAFSFDSLVHVQAEVMEAYVQQLSKKLKPTGRGFIHHSNLGAYRGTRLLGRYIRKIGLGEAFKKKGLLIDPVWRGDDVTADKFAQYCSKNGLTCTHQELINWANQGYLIDSMSTFTADKNRAAERVVKSNPNFMREVEEFRTQAKAGRKQDQNNEAPVAI